MQGKQNGWPDVKLSPNCAKLGSRSHVTHPASLIKSGLAKSILWVQKVNPDRHLAIPTLTDGCSTLQFLDLHIKIPEKWQSGWGPPLWAKDKRKKCLISCPLSFDRINPSSALSLWLSVSNLSAQPLKSLRCLRGAGIQIQSALPVLSVSWGGDSAALAHYQ